MVAGVALLPGAATAGQGRVPSATAKRIFLNSWAPSHAAGGDTTSYPLTLTTGTQYTVLVEGTFSAWNDWAGRKDCGSPGAAPIWGSSGRKNTPVGDDAVFRFASPLLKKDCPNVTVRATGTFQMNLGGGWKSFVPDGGVPSAPSTGVHAYHETVTGQGAEPKFRIVDWYPADNDGELKIKVTPAA